jgi:LPS-assembly lipoprotein
VCAKRYTYQTSWSTLLLAKLNGWLTLTVILSLTGCGFQLRNYDFEASVESFAIVGKQRAQVVAPLRRALTQVGVEESSPTDASMVIEIMDQRSERRSVSTAGQIRAAEYEVDYGVRYQLLSAAGDVLAEPIWVERQRVFRVDRGNIVGSSEEQALLQRELMQDVVGQIVRALNLVSRDLASRDPSESTGQDAEKDADKDAD